MNFKELETQELEDLISRGNRELEKRKELINAGAERNEQLRQYLIKVIEINDVILDDYSEKRNIQSSTIVALSMVVNDIKHQLEIE